MKYAKLTNLSPTRQAYSGLRDGTGRPLVLDPGETKPVHPSVVKHPAIQAAVGAGVLGVLERGAQPKAAPVPVKPADPPPPPPAEDPPAEDPPAEDPPAPSKELRDLFLEAPGITEKNVDAVLDAFVSVAELAEAEEDALIDAGVNKSFAGRVLEWAAEQV